MAGSAANITHVRDVLGRALGVATWSDAHPSAVEADALAELASGRRVSVTVKRHGQPRFEQLEGAIARFALMGEHGDARLLVLSVPRLTDGIEQCVVRFRLAHAPALDVAVVADDGAFVVEAPGLDASATASGSPIRPPAPQHGDIARQLFTPHHQLLAKVLLLQDVSDEFWTPPEQRGPYRSAGALARSVAGLVHQSTVYRFVRTFREAGYVAMARGRLSIVRPDALITAWLDHAAMHRPELYPMRSIFDASIADPVRFVEAFNGDTGAGVIGGFEACRLRGWLHTQSNGLEVHIDPSQDLHRLADALELESCDAAQAHVTLVRTPSKGRPSTNAASSLAWLSSVALPVDGRAARSVDAFQAALDCVRHPARGREQAEYIIDRLLGLRTGAR